MVSVVPSIIPILTANAVAANQSKKQKKTGKFQRISQLSVGKYEKAWLDNR